MKLLLLTAFFLGSFNSASASEQVYEMTCQSYNSLMGGYQDSALVIRQPSPEKAEEYKDLFTFDPDGQFKSSELELHIYRFDLDEDHENINFENPAKFAKKLMKTVTDKTLVAKGKVKRMYSRFGFEGHIEGQKGLQQFRSNLTKIEENSFAIYHSPRPSYQNNYHCSAPYLVDYQEPNQSSGQDDAGNDDELRTDVMD